MQDKNENMISGVGDGDYCQKNMMIDKMIYP